jgi:predicted alpha/beta hydrolase family esterase
MKKALILQGWFQKTNDNWYPWLKKELIKRKYEVLIPDLPTMQTNLPSLKIQLKHIQNLNFLDQKTSVIGHSLGCLLGLRLAEKHSFRKLILVSGWDFDDLTSEHKLFWPNKINHAKIKKNVKKIFCLHADNDPYITAFQAEEMSKRLKGKFFLIKKAGHFTAEEGITQIPELLKIV